MLRWPSSLVAVGSDCSAVSLGLGTGKRIQIAAMWALMSRGRTGTRALTWPGRESVAKERMRAHQERRCTANIDYVKVLRTRVVIVQNEQSIFQRSQDAIRVMLGSPTRLGLPSISSCSDAGSQFRCHAPGTAAEALPQASLRPRQRPQPSHAYAFFPWSTGHTYIPTHLRFLSLGH